MTTVTQPGTSASSTTSLAAAQRRLVLIWVPVAVLIGLLLIVGPTFRVDGATVKALWAWYGAVYATPLATITTSLLTQRDASAQRAVSRLGLGIITAFSILYHLAAVATVLRLGSADATDWKGILDSSTIVIQAVASVTVTAGLGLLFVVRKDPTVSEGQAATG